MNTERVLAKPSSTLQRRREGGVTNGASGCKLWRGANSGVGDAELFEVGFVFGWVEVELFEVGDEFLHFFFVEFDGGLVGWRKERFVVDFFGLNVTEIVPGLRDELRPQQKIERGEGLDLCSGGGTFVRDGRGHGNSVGPTVARKIRDVRGEH